MSRYKKYLADATIVNGQDAWTDKKFLVALWTGVGYGLDLFVVCAPDIEDVLDILANYLAKNNMEEFFYPTDGMTTEEINDAEDYGYAVWTESGYLYGENMSIEELKGDKIDGIGLCLNSTLISAMVANDNER